jgi:hypothetical protein
MPTVLLSPHREAETLVLTATQIAGFIGVGLAGAAYVPQIWHLLRVHCSAGISRFGFCLWLGASLLVTTHAIATGAVVFIVLGGVQIVATTLILLYATKYASSYCGSHGPGPLDPGAEKVVQVFAASGLSTGKGR